MKQQPRPPSPPEPNAAANALPSSIAPWSADRVYLLTEYAVLFFVLPAMFVFRSVHVPIILLLWSAAAACWWMLSKDRTFDHRALWNPGGAVRGLPAVLGLFCVGVGVLGWATSALAPDLFLSFPRERPGLWLAVLIAYPVLSVFPQNIVYRAFVFHRYRSLFTTRTSMILASAAAFCFGHIVFENVIALAVTALGGIIFAMTYDRHRSGLLVSIEHALYGGLLFTLGLGKFLYSGAVPN